MKSKFKAGDIITFSVKAKESWKTTCTGYENDFPKWAARTYKITKISEGLISSDLLSCLPGEKENLPRENFFYDDGVTYELAAPRRGHVLTTMFSFGDKDKDKVQNP